MRTYLKKLREAKEMTQEQLANQLGVSANYYCMIENGDRQKNMDLRLASKIAETLHVPIDFIVAEESRLAESA